ncbi:MAG: ABC transporter substrate-binding protein, partial [Lachnospiraceae bacterium]|nr:ABC transporter substrate-binding protein [Lachnospiraceae bacterium]
LYTMSDVLLLSGGYWYNEDIFQQAEVTEIPRTFGEFEAACRKIESWAEREKNGVESLQIPAEGYLYFVDYIMATEEGSCKEAIEQNKILIEERQMQETLKKLQNIYAYSAVKAQAYSCRDEISMFNEGKLAMYINGIWAASAIEDDIHVSYALLPAGRGTSMSCESACLGYIIGNSREEAREEASIRFLKYMMSSQVQERILKETGQMPANPNISLIECQDEMPRFYQAAETVLSADRKIEVPENLWENSSKDVFINNILDVLGGKMNGQTFIYMLK